MGEVEGGGAGAEKAVVDEARVQTRRHAELVEPDWIILDFAHHWLPPIADEHRVMCATFTILPLWITSLLSHLAFCGHEAEWVTEAWFPDASGISNAARLVKEDEEPIWCSGHEQSAVTVRCCGGGHCVTMLELTGASAAT